MLSSAKPIPTDRPPSFPPNRTAPVNPSIQRGAPTREQSVPELKSRLHWLIGLRVVVVTLVLGLSLAFQATRGELAVTFSVLIGVTYFITIAERLPHFWGGEPAGSQPSGGGRKAGVLNRS